MSNPSWSPRRFSLPVVDGAASGTAAPTPKVPVVDAPPRVRLERAARRVVRELRTWRSRLRAGDGERTVFVETGLGRRRRRLLEALASGIRGWPASPDAWKLRDVDPRAAAIILERGGGHRLTLRLLDARAKGYKKTAHFTVSYEGANIGAAEHPVIDRAIAAIAEAEATLSGDPDFPGALFDRGASAIAYYVGSGHIELRPTLVCNHHCGFCNSVDYAVVSLTRGLRDLVDLAAELDPLPAWRVVISGGEPTLLPSLHEAIAAFADRGFYVEVQTNGMAFADPAYARAMKSAGLARAFVSLHSHEAKVSDEDITRYPGGWALTVAGIDNAVAEGLNVHVNHVIHQANRGATTAFVRFAAARWGHRIRLSLSFVTPTGAAAEDVRAFIPPIPEVVSDVVTALGVAERARLPVQMQAFCGIPACLLGPYQAYSETATAPEARYVVDHLKVDACAGCVHERRCPGLWKGYFEAYGDPGVRAVKPGEIPQRPRLRLPTSLLRFRP